MFHVYLPATQETAAANAPNPIKHRGSGVILVMDDEEVVRNTVRTMLESFGYLVVCKQDGKEAVDFFESETKGGRRFAAMIFDLTIPGAMGGIEALKEIRKSNTEIPVFVSSGYADNSVMKTPKDYGFTGSISKPFTSIELSEMLDSGLSSRPFTH
jgi:CheY-like chemotaxis protein